MSKHELAVLILDQMECVESLQVALSATVYVNAMMLVIGLLYIFRSFRSAVEATREKRKEKH